MDFPGGAVDKNMPTNTGETGSIPGLGRPYALMQRSLHSRTHRLQLLKPVHPEPMLHNQRSQHGEKPTDRSREQAPLAAARESSHAAVTIQRSQKRKIN